METYLEEVEQAAQQLLSFTSCLDDLLDEEEGNFRKIINEVFITIGK